MSAERSGKPPSEAQPRVDSGFTRILLATAIAGIIGYVITWLVPRSIGFNSYATYAVFWSLLFLLIGALSGVQQEITRATSGIGIGVTGRPHRARNFGVLLAFSVFAAIVASAPLWVSSVFPASGWSLVWPLALGAASYVIVAVTAGSLYGLSAWPLLFWLISLDALLRLAAIAVMLALRSDVVGLAWAVALPFPLAPLILFRWLRKRLAGNTYLDVGYGALLWNVARTVVAAASLSAMVSGFPFLLGLTAASASQVDLGMLILVITLTRAPLVVVVMALQSLLVVFFRDRRSQLHSSFIKALSIVLLAGVVLSALGLWLGPAVFHLLFPGEASPDGWLFAVLAISSALVGALCLSGPAVLALEDHAGYSIGWLVAAMATVVGLMLPMELIPRTVLALLAGPAAGLVVHGVRLWLRGKKELTLG